MVITKLSGGLGNQMFQYAAARALSLRLKKKLLLDTALIFNDIPTVDKREYSLKIFKNIKVNFSNSFLSSGFYMYSRWDNRIRKLIGCKQRKYLRETSHSFNNSFNKVCTPILLEGYWQTEKYFIKYEDIIRHDFTFPTLNNNDKNIYILKDIQNNESVSIHVRRGDYVKYGTDNMFCGICDIGYYERAIEYLLQNKPDLKFYFFSEDANWVKENLFKKGLNANIITGNEGINSWKDMYLMSKCKHNILANSSFSWWGAWLNKNSEKNVIVPLKWFSTNDKLLEPNDIVPENWIRL